jgi:uncharacterized protein (TIGR02118 family)
MSEGKPAIKLLVMMKRKEGISIDDFVQHYESSHAPLVLRLLPHLCGYTRNYVRDTLNLRGHDEASTFDVVSEAWFATKEDYQAFLRDNEKPEIRTEIMADEAQFIDTATIQLFLVEESSSAIVKAA